ncbi:MAG: cytochrome b/b6 domain-containing protein [Hyphomicrobiales bacterium]
MQNNDNHKTKVWDGYIRVFHWLLVILILISFISIELFDNLDVHFMSGYAIVGLLIFRILWGVFGSHTAKFVNFVKGPSAIITYIKSLADSKTYKQSYGHSPIAALSVIAMLGILIMQVLSGLFLFDEESFLEGPLAQYGSDNLVSNATNYHPIGANLVLAIIAFHLIAIAIYYIFFKENLIKPMVTGVKNFHQKRELKFRHSVAIGCILCAAAIVGYIAS